MKIRKTLPLVLLAVAALFLLTSCDAMLDAIFPVPTNTLTVWVPISQTIHPYWHSTDVTVYLYNGANSLVAQQTVGYDSGTTAFPKAWYVATFSKLANGTYSLVAAYPGGSDPSASTSFFYDPNTSAVVSTISLPDANPSDSSGKTVSVVTYTNPM